MSTLAQLSAQAQRGATYLGKACTTCGSAERYRSTRACANCAGTWRQRQPQRRRQKLVVRDDTRIEAEMHAEGIVAFWRERGAKVEVEVRPVTAVRGLVCWGARITTPFDARGWLLSGDLR